MVRLKHRYLLLNILYPSSTAPQTPSSSSTSTLATTQSYIQFHQPSPQTLTSQIFLAHLRAQIKLLFGDHGLGISQSALKVIYFSQATSTIILRVPRSGFRIVWTSLTMMEGMPNPTNTRKGGYRGQHGRGDRREGERQKEVSCVVRVVRVSGTVRKAEEELVRRGRREVVWAKMLMDGKGGDMVLRVEEQEGGIGDVEMDDEGEEGSE